MIRYALAGCLALAATTGVQSYRLERVKTELHDAKEALKEWGEYRGKAEASADLAAAQCSARVAEARLSAQRIQTIIERPVHVDPQGCAVRELVPSGELRDAISPPSGSAP
jgi:F0F1-type ATP synthase membrane subunit b/b'